MAATPILPPIPGLRKPNSGLSLNGAIDAGREKFVSICSESFPKLNGKPGLFHQNSSMITASQPSWQVADSDFCKSRQLSDVSVSTQFWPREVSVDGSASALLSNASKDQTQNKDTRIIQEPVITDISCATLAVSTKMNDVQETNQSHLQQLRRTGWWRADEDRQKQMSFVKDLLRQQPVTHDPHSEHHRVKSTAELSNTSELPTRQPTPQLQKFKPFKTVNNPEPLDPIPLNTLPTNIPATTLTLQHLSNSSQEINQQQDQNIVNKLEKQSSVGSAPAAEVSACETPTTQIDSTTSYSKQSHVSSTSQQLVRPQACKPKSVEIPDLQKQLDLKLTESNSLKVLLAKAEKQAKVAFKSKQALSDINTALSHVQAEYIEEVIPDAGLVNYFLKRGLQKTLACFCKEAKLSCGENIGNYIMLKNKMATRQFSQAIEFVKFVMANLIEDHAQRNMTFNLTTSFDDLIYVLSKYLLIHMHQTQHQAATVNTLEQVIAPLIKKECELSGTRAEWFSADYQLLHDLIYDSKVHPNNIYCNFNWKTEISKFWDSAKSIVMFKKNSKRLESPPLFAFAVAQYFYADDKILSKAKDLEQMAIDAERWIRADTILKSHSFQKSNNKQDADTPNDRIPDTDDQQPKIEMTDTMACGQVETSKSRRTTTERKRKSKSAQIEWQNIDIQATVENDSEPKPTIHNQQLAMQRVAVVKTQQYQKYQSSHASSPTIDRASRTSTGSFQVDPELPPQSANVSENSNFALSNICGPSVTQVKVFDLQDIPDTGQVVVCTSGSENRHDKGITLWEMRSGSLLSHLDNGTVKPVTSLLFHPGFPELLLSADMEFDVKLWNWKEGKIIRWWRKHHSRIINQISWIPGDDTRAASCSGDQSLKFWNIHAEKPHSGSIHANEPITSFVFSGSTSDPMQQKVIVSLSYSIRIYKVRTLAMLVTIPLGDLKLCKTPVTHLSSHPIHDMFVLVSTDNQLRMFNLITQAFVKTYSARLIENGTRIKGEFSPCGVFVYATPTDARQSAHRASTKEHIGNFSAQNQHHEQNKGQNQSEDAANGVFIWRVQTGNLEKAEMRAMNDTDGWEHAGVPVRPSKMICAKWTTIRDNSKKGKSVKRKALLAAGQDQLIRLYL
ncbi:hypothetical protein O5D80_006813 [Batrachochytrium dendrobatidis]|nr:hypothetical protein O5D80_006813 [Batrachochytrium dendrobatidis]